MGKDDVRCITDEPSIFILSRRCTHAKKRTKPLCQEKLIYFYVIHRQTKEQDIFWLLQVISRSGLRGMMQNGVRVSHKVSKGCGVCSWLAFVGVFKCKVYGGPHSVQICVKHGGTVVRLGLVDEEPKSLPHKKSRQRNPLECRLCLPSVKLKYGFRITFLYTKVYSCIRRFLAISMVILFVRDSRNNPNKCQNTQDT